LLDAENAGFLNWFNAVPHDYPVIKAGLAHLWFVTIHPFEDGNGRIAQAVADMALARAEQSVLQCCSLSAQIQRERNDCYDRLEATQKGWPGCHRLAGVVSGLPVPGCSRSRGNAGIRDDQGAVLATLGGHAHE
jgi:Fic family protein